MCVLLIGPPKDLTKPSRWRRRYAEEDAAEGCELLVPRRPANWNCDECFQINYPRYRYCVMCGADRGDL